MALQPKFISSALACGGSRSGPDCIIRRPASNPDEKTIFDVQGSAYGEAFLVAPDQIDAVWFSSKLVGTIPGIGRILFTTRDERQSKVTIRPLQSGLKAVLRTGAWWLHR